MTETIGGTNIISDHKKIIAIDFDGVIHLNNTNAEYQAGLILDGPVEGVQFAIRQLRKFYEVVIYSARAGSPEGETAIRIWLKKYGIEVDDVTCKKGPSLVYVDDRAVQFKGSWEQTLKDIENFKQWLGH